MLFGKLLKAVFNDCQGPQHYRIIRVLFTFQLNDQALL
jgi:hypothetical protein